jgi:hypothetical protein
LDVDLFLFFKNLAERAVSGGKDTLLVNLDHRGSDDVLPVSDLLKLSGLVFPMIV